MRPDEQSAANAELVTQIATQNTKRRITRLRQLELKLSPSPALSRVAQDSDAKGFPEGASDELANADFIDRRRLSQHFSRAARSEDIDRLRVLSPSIIKHRLVPVSPNNSF